MAIKRASETITLEKLKEIGKATLKEPNSDHYKHDDPVVVADTHKEFLIAVAPFTVRLNGNSLALMVKALWQLNARESQQFGEALSYAYSHCIRAGAKATTGEKLAKVVVAVYNAAKSKPLEHFDTKKEPGVGPVKRQLSGAVACKQEYSPPPKSLKRCLSSPSQIAALYGGSSSSTFKVKVILACVCV